ncbi:MAG: glutaminyl-peptide cyclotransferase [Planctomycetales bacterium]|nr:glutaminyl-peptide cyclotransferase [Planctomycetales bacterium]
MAIVSSAMPGDSPLPVQAVKVIAAYPHDPEAFTQGLVVEGETLYEGTGHYGQSTLRRVHLPTGKVEQSQRLGASYFGEGITIFGDRIYQLTWKEQLCVVYDKSSLKALGSLRYSGEGWGLTSDGTQFYLSDGSSTIRVLDANFKQLRRIRVKQGRRAIEQLNELEYVRGEIYANIWYSDQIVRIDPRSGAVLGWIDCGAVYPARQRLDREQVLNGIAYDAASDRLFITGKNWPQLFEIQVLD